MAPSIDDALLSPEFLVPISLGAELDALAPSKAVKVTTRRSGPQGAVQPLTLISDPSAWYAADWRDCEAEWTYRLTPADIREVDAAIASVEARRLEVQDIKQSDFPLPTLGAKLKAIGREIRTGKGFQLIKGVPVHRYTRRQTVITYWGFGTYWGNAVTQNKKAHLVGHIKDIGGNVRDPSTRIYTTALAQPFHTDMADIVGLLALTSAQEGGMSSFSSAVTVHNEMLKRGRQDLVEELAKDGWWLDRKGEIPAGKQPWYKLPVFNYYKGFLSVAYSDTYYQLAQRHPEVPRLTEKQKEALTYFNALARSDALRVDMWLDPGDIQLLYNHHMLHSRSAYRDGPTDSEKRHLLRLWLSSKDDRDLPTTYADLWGSIEAGNRGGIKVAGFPPKVPLEAE